MKDVLKNVRGDRATELLEHISALFTKEEVIAMLTELQLEIEENSYPENVYGNEYGINEIIPTDDVYQLIQQKINALKGGTDGKEDS